MGAAGRDFHNFNTFYRDNKDYEVIAFTATQIPNIDDRAYPAELAGPGYPKGIPIGRVVDIIDEPEQVVKTALIVPEADLLPIVQPLFEAAKAHEALEAGAHIGKIILTVE